MKSIQVSSKVKNRLKKYGFKGSPWNSILNELMDHVEHCDLFWSKRQ